MLLPGRRQSLRNGRNGRNDDGSPTEGTETTPLNIMTCVLLKVEAGHHFIMTTNGSCFADASMSRAIRGSFCVQASLQAIGLSAHVSMPLWISGVRTMDVGVTSTLIQRVLIARVLEYNTIQYDSFTKVQVVNSRIGSPSASTPCSITLPHEYQTSITSLLVDVEFASVRPWGA